jgi:hypothetical protein
MDPQVTVFRSADSSASEDAANIQQLLSEAGIAATLLDDNAPGVPEGAFELRVAPEDQTRAEAIVAGYTPEDEISHPDTSAELDQVTVFGSAGTTAEMEAIAVHSLLQSNGIAAFMIGDSVLPNLSFEVRVPRENVAQARELIAEALAAGPLAAEEGEAASETKPSQ